MNRGEQVVPPDPESEDEAIGLESSDEAEEDGGPTSNSEGEEEDEPDGGVIARRFICMCAGCGHLLSIGTIGTRNGAFLFHTLILAEKLTLVCDSCLADIGLIPGDGE